MGKSGGDRGKALRLTLGGLCVCGMNPLPSPQGMGTDAEKSAEAIVVRPCAGEGPNPSVQGAVLQSSMGTEWQKVAAYRLEAACHDASGDDRIGTGACEEPQAPTALSDDEPWCGRSHNCRAQTLKETAGYAEYVRWCGRGEPRGSSLPAWRHWQESWHLA